MKTKKRYIELPSAFEELTPQDWKDALVVRQQMADGRVRATLADARRLTAARQLARRGVTAPRGRRTDYLLLVARVADSLTWLWRGQDDGSFTLVQDTPLQLMGEAEGLHGPASYGQDMLFGEWRLACTILTQYEQDPENPNHLRALAGLLWRPADGQGRRQAYDADGITAYVERGRRLQPWQQWGAYAWMTSLLASLAEDTYTIGGESVEFAPLFQGDGDGGKGGSLERIRLTLAQTHVFGTADEVDHTPLLTVLLKLLMDHEELLKLKKSK